MTGAAIAFRRRGVAIGELFFDASAEDADRLGRVDLLRVLDAFSPPARGGARERHTLVLELGAGEDALLGAMAKDTRHQIRRAARDPLDVAAEAPSRAAVDAFADFYDRFAAAHAVSPAFRPRLHALAGQGALVLTVATGEDGSALVRHAYVAARGRAFMLYSSSVLAAPADSSVRNAIGRANRHLHWHDIRLFRARGFELYDFGGIDATGRSEKTAGIARFKRGFGGVVVPVYSWTRPRSLRGRAARRLLAVRGVEF